MHPWTAVLAGLAAAALTLAGTGPALRRLPEPTNDDGSTVGDKIAYATLPTRAFVTVVTVTAGLLVGGAAAILPPAAVPLWFVLGTGGLVLAAVDARTTWLPLRLTRATWAAMVAALLVAAVLAGAPGGAAAGPPDELAVRVVGGALAAGILFGLVWRLSGGGIAFGDVRFAPLVGGAAGAVSWSLVWWALVLGAVVGGLYGLLRLVRGRRDPFPYAPSLLAGPWLALALSAWTG